MKLAGKRAIITGSSQGIGAGMARELAAQGSRVIFNTHDAACIVNAEALAVNQNRASRQS